MPENADPMSALREALHRDPAVCGGKPHARWKVLSKCDHIAARLRASLAPETDRDGRIEEAIRAGLRLAAMAQEVLAGHRAEEAEVSPGNHKCRECEQLHPCHAWTLAYEILHPLSPVGQ